MLYIPYNSLNDVLRQEKLPMEILAAKSNLQLGTKLVYTANSLNDVLR